MNNERISLQDNLQLKWFEKAMETMMKNKNQLSDYDRGLWQDLHDGYVLAGRELTVTRKQMNHIKQVAAEIESGRY